MLRGSWAEAVDGMDRPQAHVASTRLHVPDRLSVSRPPAGCCVRGSAPSSPRVRVSAGPARAGVGSSGPPLAWEEGRTSPTWLPGGHLSTRLFLSMSCRRHSGNPRRPEECEEWMGQGRRSWWAVPEPVPEPVPADR